MSKDFNVPPVTFPSGGSHFPTTTTQRLLSASNPIPFMSFDIGGSTAAAAAFPATTTVASSTFDDEPPLLEELGINTHHIYSKTYSILNPFLANLNLHEESDLSGPFLFLIAFGLFQLLAGKVHFGIILGWITVASIFLYSVFNMLAGKYGSLDLYSCLSLIGYCMLPMVILSAISLFLPQGGAAIFVLASVFVVWSTRVCTRLLLHVVKWNEHQGLIAYACFLIYTLFSLLVVF